MGSKTALRRDRHRQALIEAAEVSMVLGGLPNLKACAIPSEAGCALSAIDHLIIEDISRRRSGAVSSQGAMLTGGTRAPDALGRGERSNEL